MNIILWMLPVLAAAHPAEDRDKCTCQANRLSGGWCHPCEVGFLAGLRLPSTAFVEALDPHGHRFQLSSLRCEVCRKAMRDGGYCERCRMGFVGGLAYMSRLSFYLARGDPREVSSIQCKRCRDHIGRSGWCEACKVGMVGNVAFTDRDLFRRAAGEFDRLLKAVALSKRCETCGIASFKYGKCLTCNIRYDDGAQAGKEKIPEGDPSATDPKDP